MCRFDSIDNMGMKKRRCTCMVEQKQQYKKCTDNVLHLLQRLLIYFIEAQK
jgi:hypothetical protein